MKKIKILIIRFENEISFSETECFRGAILQLIGQDNILFHNHLGENKYNYIYPCIQYKRIGGKAAIVCLEEGTEAIGQFFAVGSFNVRVGEREVTLEVERIQAHQTLVQVWENMFTYRIRKWLPLNQENYAKYLALDSLAEKYAMLETLLTGNILSFAKGVGIHFEKQVECKITEIDEQRLITYKGVKMMAFDAEFKCNVSLPDYIGLGKGVSLGMGMVVRKYDDKKEENNE